MQATLRFTLPEEANEHRTALDGGKWKSICWEMDMWLRSEIKHGTGKLTLQDARTHFYSLLDGMGLSFEE